MTPNRLSAVVSAALPALLLATACTDFPQRQEAERARYHAYAGAPIKEFTWLGRYDGWESLGKDELVLWTSPFDAYLIKVTPPCTDLPFVNAIGLTSTARTVSARFDFVLVHSPGEPRRGFEFRCPIAEIRPVDYKRMRHDLREHAPKPANPPAPPAGQSSSAGAA